MREITFTVFPLLFLLIISLPVCRTKKRIKKANALSFNNFLKKEKRGIKKEFYFFFQDIVPPKLIRGWQIIKGMESNESGFLFKGSEFDAIGKEIDLKGYNSKDEEDDDYYKEDIYDKIAYPYLNTVIIEVTVSRSGAITNHKIVKSGTENQNKFSLSKLKKLRFNPAYLGGIRYQTKVLVVFRKVR